MASERAVVRRAMLLGAAIAAIALALTTAGDPGSATASKERSAPTDSTAQSLLLRLHDLPPGYLLLGPSLIEFPFSGIHCGLIEPIDPRPRLAAFLSHYSPAGCLALYQRIYRVPGSGPAPLAAGTGALDVGSTEGAEAGLSVSRELFSHLLGDELPREVPSTAAIGDASRLYHWDRGGLFAPSESSSSFLVWRSGSVVASVFAGGGPARANDRFAIELANRQQRHIEAPTPYTPAEQDDTEVALDNPALEVPIYWLGRSFSPGHGLQRLRLLDTYSTTMRALSGPRAGLSYVDRLSLDPAESVSLDLWSRMQWRRLKTKRGALPDSLHCATAHDLDLPKARAVLYAGFERVRPHRACPNRPPRTFTARIFLPRVVVTAEMIRICETCAEAGKGPYNSIKGMATIARSLELRARP